MSLWEPFFVKPPRAPGLVLKVDLTGIGNYFKGLHDKNKQILKIFGLSKEIARVDTY